MGHRIVRNDFVAGEIDPALAGRADLDMYYHGAARLENFIPRRTGGLRKRAGTELLWHLSSGTPREYRVVPYTYDSTAFGLLALYRARGGSTIQAQFFAHRADGTTATTAAVSVSSLTLSASERLSALRYLQIGDTLFFTYHGHRAFKCAVTFPSTATSTPNIEFSQVIVTAKPAAAPSLNAKPVNFKAAGNGYVASSRTYRLWGVKDGVLSDPTQTRADITLAWISGAYVDVTFKPDWTAHDYYILGKLQGGQYGEVTRFYPSRNAGARSDSIWNPQPSGGNAATIDGTAYTLPAAAGTGAGQIGALWKTTDTEEVDSDGRSATGWFASSLLCEYTKDRAAPVLSILLWVGVKAENGTTGEVEEVGYNGSFVVHFQFRNATSDIATWTISGQYGDSSHTLAIQMPAHVANNGVYTIYFTDESGNPVTVPVRGAILCSDSATMLFHDDNIQPGTLAGEQDALTVGDTGMDVDLLTIWQQRLVAAASAKLPFTFWFSTTGDLYNFHTYRPQNSDDAFEATMAATRATRVRHLLAEKWLLAFTDTGEFVVDAAGGAFAYNTISIKQTSSVGAHPDIVPVTTESDVLFVAADARSVYKLDYTLERDSVTPTNLSVRALHLAAAHRIVRIAYQRHPDSVLWCLLADGTLASLTYFPDEQVCGWARHTLSGGAGLRAVDIFAADSIRSDADTESTTDTFLVLEDDSVPGDVWVERLRPCVNADTPSAAAARCIDHAGYAAADYPSGGNPSARVEAMLETMRLEPQGGDRIGDTAQMLGSVLRLLRSGVVAVRPVSVATRESDAPAVVASRETSLQPDFLPVEHADAGTVSLVRGDVEVRPAVNQNRATRLRIESADEWPCEILSLLALVDFGTMKNGG